MEVLESLLRTVSQQAIQLEDSFVAGLIIGSLSQPNSLQLLKSVLSDISEVSKRSRARDYLAGMLRVYNKYRGQEVSPNVKKPASLPGVGTQQSILDK